MGTNNVDHCQRLCHSSSVAAMMAALGTGSTSNSYVDYEKAGCLMIVGSDPSSNHPVIDARLRRTLEGHQAKIIVINPKQTVLCYYADLWLQPRPGTDIALLNGIARIILDEDLWDKEFIESRTENFTIWRESLAPYSPDRVARITGVPIEAMRAAARIYARPPRGGSCLLWGMGITQHSTGTKNVRALANLALVAGQIGKPGSGISPLRGQNNVQGCSDVGCLPQFLPGFHPIDPPSIDKFSQAWGLPLTPDRGLTHTELIEVMHRGQIKAVYMMGENPSITEPHLQHARDAFSSLKFLVVQDLFLHETAAMADVILPAASFAEQDGTFTNSERRVQRVRKALEHVGQSRPDWQIVCDLARRVCDRLSIKTDQFDYVDSAQIFREMASLMPQLTGMTYERLEDGGIQWPCPTADHPGTPLLFNESFPRGRGRFMVVEQGPQASEMPDHYYPLLLNTGRMLYHWHGGTMTQKVDGLVAMMPEPLISVNPEDAAELGIADGDWAIVSSRRDRIAAKITVTDIVRRGETFMPFVAFGHSAANFLTNAVYDPDSYIPEYKTCAVRIEKA
jgi:predicted molibdopterin-dependent oxidoreductase YjgC